jgi:hypothetical protein
MYDLTQNYIEKSNQILIDLNSLENETEIKGFIQELKLYLLQYPEDGKYIGQLIALILKKLKGIKSESQSSQKKNKKSVPEFKDSVPDKKSYWVNVGNGKLKIGHKPGGKTPYNGLKNEGTSVIFTILSEREGASNVRQNTIENGMDWLLLPLANGNIPDKKLYYEIISLFEKLKIKFEKGENVYIHCAAGLHRKGMITNALLRFLGYSAQEAFDLLVKLRPLTASEVREHRLSWGEQFANT